MKSQSPLTLDQARAFLAFDQTASAPDDDELLAMAECVVDAHTVVARETADLASQGLQPSPVWELSNGVVRARLAVRPAAFRELALSSMTFDTMEDAWLDAFVGATHWFADDPVGAAHALEDTHRLWFDREAPTRALQVEARPHLRLVSMALADLGRKRHASFTPLEWLASLGLPLEDARVELGLPPEADDEATKVRVRERSVAMWADELTWTRAAFGR